MAGLDPAIHVLETQRKTWMPGTRPGMTMLKVDRNATRSLFHQRAFRVRRTERILAGDGREHLVIIPRILALLRSLDLHQPEIMHHQIVLAQLAVAGGEIIESRFPPLLLPL